MPPISVRPWAVVWNTVIFAAFGVRLLLMEEGDPTRIVVLIGTIVSGVAFLLTVETFAMSRIALRRAQNPQRLVAAITKGAEAQLGEGEVVEDALRLGLFRGKALASSTLAASLPHTMHTALGSRAAWQAALMKNRANQVVLGRTQRTLLICQPDIEARINVVAFVPFDRVLHIETGTMRGLPARRELVGILFDDGSSLAMFYFDAFREPVQRFFTPIFPVHR